MYKYRHPTPFVVDLSDNGGFEIRNRAYEHLQKNKNVSGAERGSEDQQGYGLLTEMVIRRELGLKIERDKNQSLAYDILTPTGIKIDIKCRGGEKPFLEEYPSSDGIQREAKHNLFARQVFDDRLDTDIYLMTHLERPKSGTLPGTSRQRKWKLYVCGWVSKGRAKREGVYLPRGSLTERGISGWFPYRGQEIEFYNKNLNGISDVRELFELTKEDIGQDKKRLGGLNLTSVDAVRIVYDLIGRGLLKEEHLRFVRKELGVEMIVKPFLHPNQYHHVLMWLKEKNKVEDAVLKKAEKILPREDFKGI